MNSPARQGGEGDHERFVEGVDEAIRTVDPEYTPAAAWVIVAEVADGHWGAGGSVLPSATIADLIGADDVAPSGE